MKGRKRNMEWLYRILCLGLYDTLTHCPQEYNEPKTLKGNNGDNFISEGLIELWDLLDEEDFDLETDDESRKE